MALFLTPFKILLKALNIAVNRFPFWYNLSFVIFVKGISK
jgi:hypothetical protein